MLIPKKLFLFGLFILAFTNIIFASHILEYGPTSGNYLLYIPDKPAEKMIVTLHGSGERANMYLSGWQKEADARGYYILAINSNDKNGWAGSDVQRVRQIVEKAKKIYHIRYTLLNGASAGGHFALYLAIVYPQDFSAVATFMGIVMESLKEAMQKYHVQGGKVPILLIHGTLDNKIPVVNARWNYFFLKDQSFNVTFWEEPDMQHEFYTKDNSKILNWFESVIK
ncbi:MAG: alpha/beta hydrolase-fold protein [Candidatus Margulisbacteria bacterium]|nr:alpha/beta hydrolase-fold protein [Candidatus Margulisiibacteriota bacterium]